MLSETSMPWSAKTPRFPNLSPVIACAFTIFNQKQHFLFTSWRNFLQPPPPQTWVLFRYLDDEDAWVKVVFWLVISIMAGAQVRKWIYYLYTFFSQFDNSASSSSVSILFPSEFDNILDRSCDTWMNFSGESHKRLRLSSSLLLDKTGVSALTFVLSKHAVQLRRDLNLLWVV